MRAVAIGAIAAALALWTAVFALAAIPKGLTLGVWAAHVGLGGGGHLEASVSVSDPSTKASLVFDCGKPTGVDTVTEAWDSPELPLAGGSFSFRGTVRMSRIISLTQTSAELSSTPIRESVDAEGSFNSHMQFVGTITIENSPCDRTPFTANRVPGPTPAGPEG